MAHSRALRDYLAARQITAVGEAEWRELLRELAPISEAYLRELLRRSGLPFAQPYNGIHQQTFRELECTLRDMLAAYALEVEAGDREQARYCRRQVIAAKERARWITRSPKTQPEKKAEKEEMLRWILVWLENPPVFPAWVEVRKRHYDV